MLDGYGRTPYVEGMQFDTEETPTARLDNPLAAPTLPPREPMFRVSELLPVMGGDDSEEPTRPGDSILSVLQAVQS